MFRDPYMEVFNELVQILAQKQVLNQQDLQQIQMAAFRAGFR